MGSAEEPGIIFPAKLKSIWPFDSTPRSFQDLVLNTQPMPSPTSNPQPLGWDQHALLVFPGFADSRLALVEAAQVSGYQQGTAGQAAK